MVGHVSLLLASGLGERVATVFAKPHRSCCQLVRSDIARVDSPVKLLMPGAKAYLDIPYHQMVQHGLRPSNKPSHAVFGPFPLVKQHTANSFKLDLGKSASKRVINVFQVLIT